MQGDVKQINSTNRCDRYYARYSINLVETISIQYRYLREELDSLTGQGLRRISLCQAEAKMQWWECITCTGA